MDIRQHLLMTRCKLQVFIGTPQRAEGSVRWAITTRRIITSLSGGWLVRGSKKTWEEFTQTLSRISEDFLPLAGKYVMVSFYETDAHSESDMVIVEKKNATMGVANEKVMSLSGSHTTMCKFNKEDLRFEFVWLAVKRASMGKQEAKE